MSRTTQFTHRATVVLMAVGVLVATGDGFAQSYAGLYRWAIEHGLHGWKAQSFPLLVDLFIAVGELGLFALALEGHRLKKSGMSWADLALPFAIATAGWGVSLVFNVGAVGHRFADQSTAAVPPVASMLGLLVLLRTLHRLVTGPVATGALDEPVDVADEAEVAGVVQGVWWPLPDLGAAGQTTDGYALWDLVEPEPGALATGARELPPPPPEDEDDAGDEEESDEALALVVATARDRYAEVLATGAVPSVRRIRRELRVGHPKAKAVHQALAGEAAGERSRHLVGAP